MSQKINSIGFNFVSKLDCEMCFLNSKFAENFPNLIQISKGAFSKLGRQIAQNVPEAVWLRHMDFLKYSGKVVQTDETALYSPSGLITGFSGHPCPEISGY